MNSIFPIQWRLPLSLQALLDISRRLSCRHRSRYRQIPGRISKKARGRSGSRSFIRMYVGVCSRRTGTCRYVRGMSPRRATRFRQSKNRFAWGRYLYRLSEGFPYACPSLSGLVRPDAKTPAPLQFDNDYALSFWIRMSNNSFNRRQKNSMT